jgi:cyclopropane-fatty-acyl-phospholipid synthase
MAKILSMMPKSWDDSLETATPEVTSEISRLARRGGLFALGEAYSNGDFEHDDLEGLVLAYAKGADVSKASWSWPMWRLLAEAVLKNTQIGARAFEVAHSHYDLGNDLFKVMLDGSMSYTSGLYDHGCESLSEAQEAKLRRLCHKLHLAPGMKVLDVGCGWGNFALFAARHYGVEVTGLTVSKEQVKYINEHKADLPVRVELCDYKNFAASGTFDRVVSIEMIEAVGKKNIAGYFAKIADVLKPGGRFALQAICGDTFNTFSRPALNQFILWLMKNIFPNGYIPNLEEIIRPARGAFVLESVMELPGSYEKTLRAWHSNFNGGFQLLAERYPPRFRRMWNFYLLGCAAMFAARLVQVHHAVYIKR